MLALDPRAVGEDPGGKALDPGLRANRFDALRAFDPALNIRSVLKRRPKHFFLGGAMLAPKRAVHFGLFCAQALGKSVQATGALVPEEIVCGRKYNHDRNGDHYVTRTVWIRLSPLPLLLPLSALL